MMDLFSCFLASQVP